MPLLVVAVFQGGVSRTPVQPSCSSASQCSEVCVSVYIYIYYMQLCMYVGVCMYACVSSCVCVCVFMCVCLCLHVCVFVCVCARSVMTTRMLKMTIKCACTACHTGVGVTVRI